MRLFFSNVFLLLAGFSSFAQQHLIHIDEVEYKDGSSVLTAENRGFVPYTIFLKAELTHMTSDVQLPAKIVVFPSRKPRIIARFIPQDNPFTHTYRVWTKVQFGICNGQKPDTAYAYGLPFAPGVQATVLNDPSAEPVKYKDKSVAFAVPENTAVCAARAGIVAQFEQKFTKAGGRGRAYDTNHVVVFHDDGSYALYWHLRPNGVAVQLGQRVSQGEVLGYSGQTGWARKPLLGFNVQYAGDPKPVLLPTLFQLSATKTGYLAKYQLVARE